MMRSPGDPDPTPADRSKPESSATNCSVDCVWDSRGFGSGSGGLAALVETHERNRSLQSASSLCDHRLSEDFGANGELPRLPHQKLGKRGTLQTCLKTAPAPPADSFRASRSRRI